ncbi:hypothetical protein JVU11DRAFT_5839 [Chiua virens]|nr:hypothetical protein JVU11DRAFT_5839 [Chiua virens]
MNTNDVMKMLQGQLMPQSMSSLSSILAITYIGSQKLLKNWLKSTFRVRDINISLERLADLPEDDIPDELLAVMRHEEDEHVAIRESEGYVPVDENMKTDDADAEGMDTEGSDKLNSISSSEICKFKFHHDGWKKKMSNGLLIS